MMLDAADAATADAAAVHSPAFKSDQPSGRTGVLSLERTMILSTSILPMKPLFLLLALVSTMLECSAFSTSVSSKRQSLLSRWMAPSEGLSPLSSFNALIDKRLEAVDQVPADPEGSPGSVANAPIIDFVDLLQLGFAKSTQQQARRDFAEMLRHTGGYCIVRLGDPETHIVDGLWNAMDEIYETEDMEWRHQTLSRVDSAKSHQESGYEFVQTALHDGSFEALAVHVGDDAAERAREACRLMAVLGRAFSVVAYSGVFDVPPTTASDVVRVILDDEDGSMSGSFHRLAQYVQSNDAKWRESLRPHCDWSIATPIPVSSKAGLEIFAADSWVRPELTARQFDQADSGPHLRWNSKFVTIMAGKWMELLTNGAVPSCIHRVVATPNVQSRKSAPYFMRPRPRIFEEAEQMTFANGKNAVKCIYDGLNKSILSEGTTLVSSTARDMSVAVRSGTH